jgi:hypothetical protein
LRVTYHPSTMQVLLEVLAICAGIGLMVLVALYE